MGIQNYELNGIPHSHFPFLISNFLRLASHHCIYKIIAMKSDFVNVVTQISNLTVDVQSPHIALCQISERVRNLTEISRMTNGTYNYQYLYHILLLNMPSFGAIPLHQNEQLDVRFVPLCLIKITEQRSSKHNDSIVIITKICLYNIDPLKPHFYIVKLGFTGVYIFSYCCSKT